jgi:mannose/cellobiose epimerase-like protein (N-acyl-D-glucosamine 2-epimerase family)
MATTTTPPAGEADPKQAAYDALNALLATATAAATNRDNTAAAQDKAFDVRTEVAAQLQALNLAVFTGNTLQLQAAGDEMAPAMTQLKALKTQIEALGNDLKEAAAIISGIDKVAGEFGALGL